MTVCGGNKGNLSPPAHLPLPSSSVSGMGGMSSVPCARERAELVRAWWVTASGSGVAICGDTGTKLDRSVPAGFETGPARDPGKSPRAGCPGHHHQTFKSGHDVHRASRTPLISPGRKLVEGFVLTRLSSPFYGEVDRRKAARRRGAAPAASCLRQAPPPPGAPRRPLRPLLRQGYGGPTSPWNGKKERAAFQVQAPRGPGTGAGESGALEEERPLTSTAHPA